jgi:rod shape-determining protein MreD
LLTYEATAAPRRRTWDVMAVLAPALALTLLGSQPAVVRTLGQACPDWPVVAVVLLALRARPWQACASALVLGLLQDGLTLVPEGLGPLSLITVALVLIRIARVARIQGYAKLATLMTLAAFLDDLIMVPGLLTIMGHGRTLTGAILAGQVQTALATALVGPPLFWMGDRLLEAIESRRRG